MGEEKKQEEKKAEEGKKVEVVEKKAVAKEEKPAATEEKPKEAAAVAVEEKKSDDDKKDSKEEQPSPPPPPPPPEIVLRVFMHCEGCARKVRKCLKGFDGVEDVTTDCKTHKVVVKGEKADPLKVLGRLQKKTNRQVELLSPIPKPPEEEPKKPEEKEAPKPEEKKDEPKVVTVVLKVHMHCEACSLEIKRRIQKMKDVEEAIPDLKNSQVTVKGTFDPSKLVEYVYKRTGKHAAIVKQDHPAEKKEDDKGKDEKKGDKGDGGKKGEEKTEEGKGEKKEDGGGEGSGAAAGDEGKAAEADGGAVVEEGAKVVELRRNECLYYPPRYAMEMHAYPPQIFSDENPNACSIM